MSGGMGGADLSGVQQGEQLSQVQSQLQKQLSFQRTLQNMRKAADDFLTNAASDARPTVR